MSKLMLVIVVSGLVSGVSILIVVILTNVASKTLHYLE